MYSDNYIKVKGIIEARREDARRLSDVRSEELRARSSEIREIDEELRKTGPNILRAAFSGKDIAPIKERNQMLLAKRREVVRSLGYPEDYSDVKYVCKKCSDTGFVDIYMCSCFKELLQLENIKSSGMGKLIERQSFDNFDLSHYEKDSEVYELMRGNLAKAKLYADGFGTTYKGSSLLFMGKTGTGKTHISTAIAKVVISKGYDVKYDSAQNIVSAFENDKFRSGYGQYEPTADKYLECDLLIIDDLGTEFLNQFTVSCLYNLLNSRRNNGLSTIISTNLTADELANRYDDRIYSRIMGLDCFPFHFGGDDYRLYGKCGK